MQFILQDLCIHIWVNWFYRIEWWIHQEYWWMLEQISTSSIRTIMAIVHPFILQPRYIRNGGQLIYVSNLANPFWRDGWSSGEVVSDRETPLQNFFDWLDVFLSAAGGGGHKTHFRRTAVLTWWWGVIVLIFFNSFFSELEVHYWIGSARGRSKRFPLGISLEIFFFFFFGVNETPAKYRSQSIEEQLINPSGRGGRGD